MPFASSCLCTNVACLCSVRDYASRLDVLVTDPKRYGRSLWHYFRCNERLEAKDEELRKNTKILRAKKRLEMVRNHFLGKINAGCNDFGIGKRFIYNSKEE